jgi:subtilase family serine protease
VRLDADGDEAGDESVDGLEAGKEREVRFGDVRLKKGEHKLSATLDQKHVVAESNDENNERTAAATCRAD